jgi:hypothetical protein
LPDRDQTASKRLPSASSSRTPLRSCLGIDDDLPVA